MKETRKTSTKKAKLKNIRKKMTSLRVSAAGAVASNGDGAAAAGGAAGSGAGVAFLGFNQARPPVRSAEAIHRRPRLTGPDMYGR